MVVLVIGGSGRTGRHVVQRLQDRGDEVRVMSRRPRAGAIVGDLADREAVARAIEGVDAVVVSVEPLRDAAGAEAVMHHGLRHLGELAAARRVQVVLVSQIYITRPEMMGAMAEMVRARGRGEEALRASGAPYTIVRPSWLTDEPGSRGALRAEQGDTGDGQVTREDVAEATVQALAQPAARGKTFELYNAEGAPETDWPALFADLRPD
jgi:uncharacterized protein YbjT (DUF2867 family)